MDKIVKCTSLLRFQISSDTTRVYEMRELSKIYGQDRALNYWYQCWFWFKESESDSNQHPFSSSAIIGTGDLILFSEREHKTTIYSNDILNSLFQFSIFFNFAFYSIIDTPCLGLKASHYETEKNNNIWNTKCWKEDFHLLHYILSSTRHIFPWQLTTFEPLSWRVYSEWNTTQHYNSKFIFWLRVLKCYVMMNLTSWRWLE